MEKETIEEAAEKLFPDSSVQKRIFIKGAKWQQEQNKNKYTYDEMRGIAYQAYCLGQLDEPTEGKYNLWIQQFKSE